MAIPMYGSVSNLRNRIATLAAVLQSLKSYQTTLQTNLINTSSGIVAQYNAESDLQAEIGNSSIPLLNSPGAIGNKLSQLAEDTVNRMVFRDTPQLNQNLTNV